MKKFCLTFTLIICSCLAFLNINVNAETMYEIETNNSKQEAELIQANRMTMDEYESANFTNQFVVKGYSSTDDEDWYKVYLTSGTQYMSCNDDAFYFTITNEDNTYNITKLYSNNRVMGVTPYELNIPETGYYFIRITGIFNSQHSYIFTIGDPDYSSDKCILSCENGNITMDSSHQTKIATFNASEKNTIPDGAIATDLFMSGVNSTWVEDIYMSNSEGLSIKLHRYARTANNLVSMKMHAKDIWKAEFEYYKDKTFTPTLELWYVYPVIS